MFKRYADFSSVHGTPEHPGQPAHCGHHADVWHKEGKYVLFPFEGEPVKFDTLAAVHEHCEANAELIQNKQGERAVRESLAEDRVNPPAQSAQAEGGGSPK